VANFVFEDPNFTSPLIIAIGWAIDEWRLLKKSFSHQILRDDTAGFEWQNSASSTPGQERLIGQKLWMFEGLRWECNIIRNLSARQTAQNIRGKHV
jgi:hypothetical protein